MKNIKSSIYAVAIGVVVLSMTYSCSSDIADQDSATKGTELEIESVGIVENVTRSAFTGKELPSNYNYGLYVTNGKTAYLTNKQMTAGTTSTGVIINDEQVRVGACYPYSSSHTTDTIAIYPGETDYMSTDGDDSWYTESNPQASINLHHALARVTFIFETSDNTSYDVSCPSISNVFKEGTMNVFSSDEDVSKETTTVNLGVTSSSAQVERLFLPQNLEYTIPTMVVTINGKSTDIGKDLIEPADYHWQAGYSYTYRIIIKNGNLNVSGSSIDGWGTAENLGSLTGKRDVHYEFVNLGLPSGTLWSTMNVGAYSPEECGEYFAWGETSSKSSYTWDNYKWGKQNAMSKYNSTDKLTTLDLDDDAAYINCGDSLRMPTAQECQELLDNCTWTWTSNYNGTAGYLVKSTKNDNQIFIPASGYCKTSATGVGDFGYYWSSSLYSSKTGNNAYYMFFDSDNQNTGNFSRCYGRTIRPVCNKIRSAIMDPQY